ncbi:hypothetical protein JQX09_20320 [Sulfitobacter pseudonitzschiae]|uniref:Uncharacterized protein n=1 Tax=Pseudosulfitobacter pseudonitzschiae TaxID=1402135 RepID=A0A9Q2NRJ1_9RHOB|nr:hypothetical protein [Pseudosulfitobacter pseudonitzschiae]MBM2294278.1 hypothetical protein [Pseudosulfitobacter pseudonitzschiae]MBM2299202.1 hypothetical protein [Pseudosulfitobacter pseudonitzschiae]MBM2304110.1 hypothetical protein [Pseudosulfitobacter pseudonitzschiae]MBM2313891.1 hypothetical protein [Pseudosulfitobacter pseudonitzschiae]MBM2318805.1 hypothetical protein [Pseudosulfitobacter pseudonitzschiae]
MKPTNSHFEPKPRWILSVPDLSNDRGSARYLVTRSNGETAEVILNKRKRQVVDTLLKTELFCASTVRIGDVVFRLKEDDDLHAETKALANGRKYYSLSGVTYLGPVDIGNGGAA